MRFAALLCAMVLSGCGFDPSRLFASHKRIDVREIARSLQCHTPADVAQAQLFRGAQAVLDWQSARGVELAGPESLARATYVVVEMGERPTGGYGLAVARAADLSGERLTLQATFVSPAPTAMRAQVLTSPCVLVQLPPGRYATVEVRDPGGALRASGDYQTPAPPPPPEAPAPEAAPEGAPPAEAPATAPEPEPPADPPADTVPDAAGEDVT